MLAAIGIPTNCRFVSHYILKQNPVYINLFATLSVTLKTHLTTTRESLSALSIMIVRNQEEEVVEWYMMRQ